MWYKPMRRTHLSVYAQAESAQGMCSLYEAIEHVIETQSFKVNYFVLFAFVPVRRAERRKNKLIF